MLTINNNSDYNTLNPKSCADKNFERDIVVADMAHLNTLMPSHRIYSLRYGDESMNKPTNQHEQTDNPILVCSIQPTYSCNIDKALDVIAQNQDAVIILSSGVAFAFVLFGLGHGISLVVAKLKLKQ